LEKPQSRIYFGSIKFKEFIMKTKRFVFSAVIITVFITIFMTACSNPFLHKEEYDYSENLSLDGIKTPGTSPELDIPLQFVTTSATSSSITISWSPVGSAKGYYVYRSSTATGTYTPVKNTTSTTYTDTGLLASTTYYYKVAAYDKTGTSFQTGYIYAATQSSSTFSITISGTPKIGQKLTAVTTGSGWTGNFKWGYAASGNASSFTPFTSGTSGSNNSEFTIPAGYNGMYIRAFRQHPNGNWVDYTVTPNVPVFPSNFLGPIQP
jgi:hypothetical protein